ncbi:MAG: inorganic phosphate transporter, partial [Myxococcales bacterium]|nr:inorganic phosphate transporter [Myxococcales bacterium]
NDVANAMGTSVGSGALTIRQAIVVAGLLEFAGAFLVGGHVTDTVRKGMIDLDQFTAMPTELALGMMASLLAAGLWLQFATYFGMPVSTTHTIVGAIVGFASVVAGVDAVQWSKVASIVASWVVSPLAAGTVSFVLFVILRGLIINARDPVRAMRNATPVIVFIVGAVLTQVTLYKGLKHLDLHLTGPESLGVAGIVGLVGAAVAWGLLRARTPALAAAAVPAGYLSPRQASLLGELDRRLQQAREAFPARASAAGAAAEVGREIGVDVDALLRRVRSLKLRVAPSDTHPEFVYVERIFGRLQILSACAVAFAHGANDVANAVGPMAAVLDILKSGSVQMKVAVSPWVLALGGAGIVLGLATWGYRVIETVGRKITELTPSRGFAAEFGTAVTILVASRLGWPISTTHTLVGAVLGVGLARGFASLNLRMVRDIALSWMITVPAGAALAVVCYKLLAALLL